jgi:hypothetical protein
VDSSARAQAIEDAMYQELQALSSTRAHFTRAMSARKVAADTSRYWWCRSDFVGYREWRHNVSFMMPWVT